ncbi:MAG: aminotransferase class IV [Minisyncoccia bacterium]
MARIYDTAYFEGSLVPVGQANISVATSAVLYGLSVYTVFPVCIGANGEKFAFRIKDHYKRLVNSARIIGIDTFETEWTEGRFISVMEELVRANTITEDVFVRATIHVTEMLPGTRSRGMKTTLSAFIYEAVPILPQNGARLKTSVWRRVPDYAIPSRAKVNGAYVNSVLAKQDAIDSGYDDCILLDVSGHVCELSAANLFIIRDGILITPDTASDLLEGISRKTVLEMAKRNGIPTIERGVDLTELYVADELFACGTSALIAPILEVDARPVANKAIGPVTLNIRDQYKKILHGEAEEYRQLLTSI